MGEARKPVHEHEHNEYEHNEHGSSGGFGQASISTGRTAADRVGAAVVGSNAADGAYGLAGVAYLESLDLSELYRQIQFVVRGLRKTKAVSVWHALAHNFQRTLSLRAAAGLQLV